MQAKICAKLYSEILPLEFAEEKVGKLLFTIWSISGDFI